MGSPFFSSYMSWLSSEKVIAFNYLKTENKATLNFTLLLLYEVRLICYEASTLIAINIHILY